MQTTSPAPQAQANDADADPTNRETTSTNAVESSFLQDVVDGLGSPRKHLDPKYFYDQTGSALFEEITTLPEYYITRVETAMMREISSDLAQACSECRSVVEFGSGSGVRSDILLDSVTSAEVYVPIDVSPSLLESTRQVVRSGRNPIRVSPVLADFTRPMTLPEEIPATRLGYFPGSTIGNFLPLDASSFLVNARLLLGPGALMLLGADLVKPVEILHQAYNDPKGVTARFNKNILVRINRELDGDFDVDQFRHHAFFNRDLSRIEMHLVSEVDQRVTIGDQHSFEFNAGESIHSENSHKFTMQGVAAMADSAGWNCEQSWTDPDRLFSLHLLRVKA